MKKTLLFAAPLSLLVACNSSNPSLLADGSEPLSVRMVQSEMRRNPSPTNLDGIPEGQVKWNYTTGLELQSFLDVAEKYDREDVEAYVERYYDTMVRPDAQILTYKRTNFNLDHICPGRPLFTLYERTGEERYRMALDTLHSQMEGQPRTPEGGYWHKKVYPHQMWLDGLYMAEPFHAEYVKRFIATADPERAAEIERDIVNQFLLAARYTYDPETELFRHAWDSSKQMFWCNPETGQSAHAWGRAVGWYAIAIVETLDYLSPEAEGREGMIQILNHLYKVLPRYASPQSGMWYQVLDSPEREGNYEEATSSIMFIYAQLKGVRKGYLPKEMQGEALERYERFVERFVRENEDGTISITDCCAVGGLGGKQMRDGSFEYYLSEPIIENDCKGVGPFVWASLEYEYAKGRLATI
uniref:glycoside hydrolase family 88/105 protein n=1 Tax=Alistipes sp. TaxID=1872444 RepID=UPI0040577793